MKSNNTALPAAIRLFKPPAKWQLVLPCLSRARAAWMTGPRLNPGWFAALALLTLPVHAAGQTYVGLTSGFTGPAGAGVKENLAGARLAFDDVNAKGGVNGQRIEILVQDDGNDAGRAVSNARKLVAEQGAIALFLTRGTPLVEAMRPLLRELRVPMVASSTGAMSLHRPTDPWIFNVRSPYQREGEKAIQHLTSVGVTRIVVWQADDSFGADAVAGADLGFVKAGIKPLSIAKFDRASPSFGDLAASAAKQDAQAVLLVGSSQAVADGVKALRARGSRAQVVTLSNNASSGFVRLLGEHARGIIVTQVFPNERAIGIPLVREANALAKSRGADGVTPAMMEGFAGAKVLIEGLRRAGARPTRDSLIAALNTMLRFDLGGMELSFSQAQHSGLGYVELSIIDGQGKFVR